MKKNIGLFFSKAINAFGFFAQLYLHDDEVPEEPEREGGCDVRPGDDLVPRHPAGRVFPTVRLCQHEVERYEQDEQVLRPVDVALQRQDQVLVGGDGQRGGGPVGHQQEATEQL